MESSYDDFAWSNASTCSEDSDIEHTMTGSESDKKYKKKLHMKLFEEETEAEVKAELMNGKVKHESGSQELDSSAFRVLSPIPPSRKRKRERQRERASSQGSEPDLHLLEKRVKREQSVSHAHNEALEGGQMKDETNINDSSQEFDGTVNVSKTLKKQKSKRKLVKQLNNINDENETDMIIEDKFHAEETIVAFRHESSLSNEDAQETELVIENDTAAAHKSKKGKKKKHKDQKNTDNSRTESESVEFECVNQYDSKLNDDNESTEQSNVSTLLKKTTKISDRIYFEDEDHLEPEHSESAYTHTAQLQRFLRTYPRLQPFRAQPHLAALSKDEDVWLLNCPKEIDITSLQGIDMSLDSKSKLKTNNHTYIGNIQNGNSTIPILIFEHKKPVVKNIILNGIVNYRKRVPKPHYVHDNMIQNQSDFIPLPETKYRHPLFGSDYKKAIKIPSAIKARLNNSYVLDNIASLERKNKKNKTQYNQEYLQNSNALENEVDGKVESGNSGDRRKQRPSTLDESQSAPKKKKKKSFKQDISIGSWDSEKAIEENLFNF